MSQELSFSGLPPSDTISSRYLPLNYARASIPEKSFRMFIVENALKKQNKGGERMKFRLIDQMPFAAKDAKEIINVVQENQRLLFF